MMRFFLAAALLCGWAPAATCGNSEPVVKVTTLLKSATTWNGAVLAYPQGQAELSVLRIDIASGGQTTWHAHPIPSIAYVLEGTLEVSLANGESKTIHAGGAFAEVVNTLHMGRALNGAGVKLLVVYPGASGLPLNAAPPVAPAS